MAQKAKKTSTNEERAAEHAEMWNYFPERGDQILSCPYPKRHTPKLINKNFTNKCQRIHTAVKDTYAAMEDNVNTNCEIAIEGSVSDIKVYTWNCGGCTEEKLRSSAYT